MSKFRTEQEEFWAGDFGNEYVERNTGDDLVAASMSFFAQVLPLTSKVETVLEFGSNLGLNLKALKQLLPSAYFSAIEINENAVSKLESLGFLKNIFHQSILDFEPETTHDLVFIRGVLIHITPEVLNEVYQKLYDASSKYILLSEYYNPVPVSVPYRGHDDKLFKRDWAGEMMDEFPDLRLVHYGFLYHRDNAFRHGDETWFLLEKP